MHRIPRDSDGVLPSRIRNDSVEEAEQLLVIRSWCLHWEGARGAACELRDCLSISGVVVFARRQLAAAKASATAEESDHA